MKKYLFLKFCFDISCSIGHKISKSNYISPFCLASEFANSCIQDVSADNHYDLFDFHEVFVDFCNAHYEHYDVSIYVIISIWTYDVIGYDFNRSCQ